MSASRDRGVNHSIQFIDYFQPTTVHIKVGDINDSPPVFTATSISRRVRETDHIGTMIVMLQASDADTGENARITYTIEPAEIGKVFSVSSTGEIRNRVPLDRETTSQYNFIVNATDNGKPSYTTQAHISVTLLGMSIDMNEI